MAKLSTILIFPIKSLDPIALNEVEISVGGALKGDYRAIAFQSFLSTGSEYPHFFNRSWQDS